MIEFKLIWEIALNKFILMSCIYCPLDVNSTIFILNFLLEANIFRHCCILANF